MVFLCVCGVNVCFECVFVICLFVVWVLCVLYYLWCVFGVLFVVCVVIECVCA